MNAKEHNLLTRTVTGLIFVTVVLAGMLCGGVSYIALLLCIAGFCTTEFLRLARGRTQKWSGTLYIMLCMTAMGFFPVIGSGMTSDVHLWSGSVLWRGEFPDGWDARIAPAFMAVVWMNDIFAYLVGVAFGKHKMSPRISPHKSWEGFAGGIIGATVASALIGRYWAGGEVWLWTIFGLLAALAAVGGDLVESRFKRAAGVKDSGRMLPGHGGMLDRFDATLGAVPVAFLFFLVTYLIR